MDIQFFKANLYSPSIFIPKMKKEWKGYFEWKAFKQYDPACHEIVTNKTKRKDKKISVPIPGAACDPITGKAPEELQTVHVARIPLALQRIITNRRTAFLTGGKIELKSKPIGSVEQAMYDAVTQTWRRNKLDFKNSAISKAFMSETECAEIWYSKVNEDMSVSMRCNIFSPSKGYELIPVFDNLEDLLAFGLGYESTDVKGNKIKCMDIYDKDYISKYEDTGKGWQKIQEDVDSGIKWQIEHKYGKIPVIYYSLEKAIWADVQVMIERLETLISNFADTNDYNGSPILFAKGAIEGWSTKGETGKVIQGKDDPNGEGDADLKYVNWDQAPESIKLEIETLTDFIYSLSQTPNLSFKAMSGLGDISGAAFDRMMIDSHLAAADLQNGMYGECIQRRLNFLCYAMAATQKGLEKAKDMEITAVFNKFSIDNVSDRIDNAKKANGGKPVIDQLGSIKMAGLTDDPEATYQLIQEESAQEIEIPALV